MAARRLTIVIFLAAYITWSAVFARECGFTVDELGRTCCVKTSSYCSCNYALTELKKCFFANRPGPGRACPEYEEGENEVTLCCEQSDLEQHCTCKAGSICQE